MRYSQTLIPTVKEVPADAEIASHQLMLRAGVMRKVASGTYTYLPIGWRSILKVMNIVRQEMDRAGGLEILMPSVHPLELWQRTGRDVDYGETMTRFIDRHGRGNILAPTAEEVVTDLAAHEINSYKQLPLNLYQISFKFRDEFRPRFGVLRSREFIMKDAYSFHATPECLDRTYRVMYETYCRIFRRCGLEYVIVEAETGEMGGSGSHQFTVPCASGEDVIVYTEDGSYAANIEKAEVDPLPKSSAVSQQPSAMEEVHTPNVGSIEAVCEFMKTRPADMIKTLIYKMEDGIVMILIRGDHEVNAEKLAQAVGGRHIEMADEATIVKLTGAAVGFAGPQGLAGKLRHLFVDHAVCGMASGITGANKTDYHARNVVPGRDFPLDGANVKVCDIRNAVEGDTHGGKKLLFKRGIEIGQVFKLGTKYSVKLGANFLGETGVQKPCLMGCYGIGINRIVASAIELGNDENGIVWPISIAPYEVIVTSVGQEDEVVAKTSERIYKELLAKGLDVLFDDRPGRAGVKFKDADLIGIPVRVTVGKKTVAEGKVEVKLRNSSQNTAVAIDAAAGEVLRIVNELKAKLHVDA